MRFKQNAFEAKAFTNNLQKTVLVGTCSWLFAHYYPRIQYSQSYKGYQILPGYHFSKR